MHKYKFWTTSKTTITLTKKIKKIIVLRVFCSGHLLSIFYVLNYVGKFDKRLGIYQNYWFFCSFFYPCWIVIHSIHYFCTFLTRLNYCSCTIQHTDNRRRLRVYCDWINLKSLMVISRTITYDDKLQDNTSIKNICFSFNKHC